MLYKFNTSISLSYSFFVLNIILLLVALTISGLVLYYTYVITSKTCNCPIDWKHYYVRYYQIFNIIILSLLLLSFILNIFFKTTTVNMLLTPLSLANIFIFFFYVRGLEKSNCQCIHSNGKYATLQKFMYYYSYVPLILVPIGFILTLTIIFYFLSNRKK